MIKINDISIRSKLVGMQVITSLLVLGIFSLIFIMNELREYKQRKIDNILSMARVVGNNSVSTLTFRDDDEAHSILENLYHVTPGIEYAGILNADGTLFAGYSETGNGFQSTLSVLGRDTIKFQDNRLFIHAAIIDLNKPVGSVLLAVEMADLAEMKKATIRTAIVLLLVALALSVIVAVLMQTTITRRLARLVGTMEEVSRTGDYSLSLTDDGKDEISTLIRGFNEFTQQINVNQQKKDEFIGIASHELKTPLTSIKGYLELLKGIEDRPMHANLVAKASKNVIKLENLLKDLLDVSKIQGGQLELNCQDFDLTELIEEAIAAIEPVYAKHQISFDSALDRPTIYADRQRLEQVLINLLSNALKYSPPDSSIIVSCQRNDKEIVVQIRDFGIGIPVAEQSYIFERFYRTRDSSIHIAGFGLGLYICKDIITRHKGKIWVNSEGQGSTFSFSLPLSEEKNS